MNNETLNSLMEYAAVTAASILQKARGFYTLNGRGIVYFSIDGSRGTNKEYYVQRHAESFGIPDLARTVSEYNPDTSCVFVGGVRIGENQWMRRATILKPERIVTTGFKIKKGFEKCMRPGCTNIASVKCPKCSTMFCTRDCLENARWHSICR